MVGKTTILGNRVYHLKTLIAHESQCERRDTLLFLGDKVPDDSPGEICKLIIHKLIMMKYIHMKRRKHIGGNLNVNGISTAHRIGPQTRF